jgi:hypothetical protein
MLSLSLSLSRRRHVFAFFVAADAPTLRRLSIIFSSFLYCIFRRMYVAAYGILDHYAQCAMATTMAMAMAMDTWRSSERVDVLLTVTTICLFDALFVVVVRT